MAFEIPNIEEVTQFVEKLKPLYCKERQLRDAKRFFGSVRSETHNQKRLEDIDFISILCRSINANKDFYSTLDSEFEQKPLDTVTKPFLRDAIAGSMFLSLFALQEEYSGNEKKMRHNSVLGKILLQEFGIENYAEIPKEDELRCLSATKRYLNTMKRVFIEPIRWHIAKTNESILHDIDKRSGQLEGICHLKIA